MINVKELEVDNQYILKSDQNESVRGKVLIGDNLSGLPDELLQEYGAQVSLALSQHTDTMLQYAAEEIVDIVKEGRAVMVINTDDHLACLAFAQISPWVNEQGEVVAAEFRSWKSWSPHQGIPALIGGVNLSEQLFPGVPAYGIVEAGNIKAQKKFLEAGATSYEGMPPGMTVVLKDGEASVLAFSLKGVKTKGEL